MRDRLLDHLDIVLVEFLPRLTLQNCFQIRKLHFPLHCRAGWQEGLYNGFLVFVAGLFLSANEWKILFSEDRPRLVLYLFKNCMNWSKLISSTISAISTISISFGKQPRALMAVPSSWVGIEPSPSLMRSAIVQIRNYMFTITYY